MDVFWFPPPSVSLQIFFLAHCRCAAVAGQFILLLRAGLVRARFYLSLVGDICLLGSDYFRVRFWLFVVGNVSGFRIWFLRLVMFGGRTSCCAAWSVGTVFGLALFSPLSSDFS